ncbi:MAG TPA: hypothetical protein VE964_13140 [Myxococcales bacterium]|nr:hypothetical protein [Myxococcales bacterium]
MRPSLLSAAGVLAASLPLVAGANGTELGQPYKLLSPGELSALPAAIKQELDNMGCRIPQAYEAQPNNAVQGEFARKGQKDWAVLCSKGGSSRLLIFWGGPAKCPDPRRVAADQEFLQSQNDQKAGATAQPDAKLYFSRMIAVLNPEATKGQFAARGGKKLAPDHDGIEESIPLEQSSIVHYCANGRWAQAAYQGE